MRLLHARTRQFRWFEDSYIMLQRYAILSHTWEEEEVSFQDMQRLDKAEKKAGYRRINFTCQQALRHGLEYVWIDTCCIDKSSSAELSEAINAMFKWYQNSYICYAYLTNVHSGQVFGSEQSSYPGIKFSTSRWFTRGWTLQELIAPILVEFYSSDWKYIGEKSRAWHRSVKSGGSEKYDLCPVLEEITTVPSYMLQSTFDLKGVSVAKKMSWAAKRKTTRLEDQAYCLLGLFDVNLPMIYGEGVKTFQRLQEAILRSSADHTILAWSTLEPTVNRLLASSPRDFKDAGKVVRYVTDSNVLDSFEMTHAGLRINLPLLRLGGDGSYYMLLDARYEDDFEGRLGVQVELVKLDDVNETHKQVLIIFPYRDPGRGALKVFTEQQEQRFRYSSKCNLLLVPDTSGLVFWPHIVDYGTKIWVRILDQCSEDFEIVEASPNVSWNDRTKVLSLPGFHRGAEPTAMIIFKYPRVPESPYKSEDRNKGFGELEQIGEKHLFRRYFIVLLIRVSQLGERNQICFFKASMQTEPPNQDTIQRLDKSDEQARVPNDEYYEEHALSDFTMDGYVAIMTVCRKVERSVPVYVVDLAPREVDLAHHNASND